MIKFDEYKKEVNAIKMIIKTLPYADVCITDVIDFSIELLLNILCKDKKVEKKCRLLAVLFVKAFVELGFNYDSHASLFDEALRGFNLNKKDIIIFSGKDIRLNKTQVRSMIARWKPSPYNSHKIKEVVEDIIYKVQNGTIGTYYYYSCAHNNDTDKEVYELVVTNSESYFYDHKRQKFYNLLHSTTTG